MQIDYSDIDFSIISHMKEKFDTMPKAYKKIAEFLIENRKGLAVHSITTLSKKIGISPSTITRFCQSLNLSGFPELKFCMNKDVRNPEFINGKTSTSDTIAFLKNKLWLKYVHVIKETISLINERDLESAANSIMNAEKIVFFAHGGSAAVSQIGQGAFIQIGIPCYCFPDTFMSHIIVEQLSEKDIALGISNSGNSKTTIDALRSAKKNGVTTIGITGNTNSLITRYSDIILHYNLDDDLRYNHIARICETVIIGTLITYIMTHNYDKLQKKIQLTKETKLKGRY